MPNTNLELKGNTYQTTIGHLLDTENKPDSTEPLYCIGNDTEFIKQHLKRVQPTFKPVVNVMGARRCDANTKKRADDFTEIAIKRGYTIACSGAEGCEEKVLQSIIRNKAQAFVFLGSITDIYPHKFIDYYQKIIDLGGAVVSQNDQQAIPYHLRERRRLMTLFSDIVICASCDFPSGSCDDAKLALENNIPVWCVPNSEGNWNLIRQGATLVANNIHIMSEFYNFEEKHNLPHIG